MPDNVFYAYGANILGNPSVGTTATGGNGNEGFVTVNGGSLLFEPDDFVVFGVQDATASGELQDASAITDVTVYDSYADFLANAPAKYTYLPQNAGQTQDVQDDEGGMGDTYLFSTLTIFQSSDPGAPILGSVLITPLIDWTVTSPTAGTVINRLEDVDYDNSGGIDSGTQEAGNTAYNLEANNTALICFAAGTWIDTPGGSVPVDTLRVGDSVMTLDSGPRAIRWIGRNTVPAKGRLAPVRISSGVFSNARPVTLSLNHRVLIEGAWPELLFGEPAVLCAIKHLVNGRGIARRPTPRTTYYHFLLDRHELVSSGGLWSESLYPGEQTRLAVEPDHWHELTQVLAKLPDLSRTTPLARPVLHAYEAQALRAALAEPGIGMGPRRVLAGPGATTSALT